MSSELEKEREGRMRADEALTTYKAKMEVGY